MLRRYFGLSPPTAATIEILATNRRGSSGCEAVDIRREKGTGEEKGEGKEAVFFNVLC